MSTDLVGTWLREVATKSGQSEEVVGAVLREHGVRAQTILPRPHRILVTELRFHGGKPKSAEAPVEEPFEFEWRLDAGIWCLASRGKNEAGKSSVLEIMLWCLRGRSDVQADVRNWLRHVRLSFTLDGERVAVDFDVINGVPRGQVRSEDAVFVTFDGIGDFERSMDAFMLERMGLEPLRTAQAAPGGQEAPPITGELSWPSYSSALHINRAGLGSLLGSATQHALPTRLLELFLGAPWAATKVAAMVAARVVNAELSAARKRAEGDAAARDAQLGTLRVQLDDARTRLQTLATVGGIAGDVTTVYTRLTHATDVAATARSTASAARQRYEELLAQQTALRKSAIAAAETALARRFFHALVPTVCPRCDTAVGRAQLAREQDGHCSLCTADLRLADPHTVEPAGDDDDPTSEVEAVHAALELLEVSVLQARQLAEQAQRDAETAEHSRQQAQSVLAETLSSTQAADRRTAEIAVARLEGAVADREGRMPDAGDRADIRRLEQTHAVLKAAENAAHERRTAALRNVLNAVNEDIVQMARALGMEMLERAELGTSATLTVWKGGQKSSYGSLTEGEQLRLKIVATIALLRHGTRTGVGRHPGLLLVDSPGAEEVDSGDLRQMVNDLVLLADIAPELQVIIATARGAEVEELIPAERLRIAAPGERLW